MIEPVIETAVHHLDPLAGYPASHQVVARALRDHHEALSPIGPRNHFLERHHVGAEEGPRFLKGGLAEEVRHDDADLAARPPWREARHLVDVLDHQIGGGSGELALQDVGQHQVEVPPFAAAHHAHSLVQRLRRRSGEAAGQPRHVEPAAHGLAQDPFEVQLGAARLGVGGVAEIDGEQAAPVTHGRSATVPIT